MGGLILHDALRLGSLQLLILRPNFWRVPSVSWQGVIDVNPGNLALRKYVIIRNDALRMIKGARGQRNLFVKPLPTNPAPTLGTESSFRVLRRLMQARFSSKPIHCVKGKRRSSQKGCSRLPLTHPAMAMIRIQRLSRRSPTHRTTKATPFEYWFATHQRLLHLLHVFSITIITVVSK